jgi:predicted outer membrane protein
MLASVAVAVLAVQAAAQNSPRLRERAPATQNRQPAATGQYTVQRPAGQPAEAPDLSRAIAGCLLLGNQEEIALAEFAQSRAQDPKVKEFAQMLVADHEKAVAKLAQLEPELAQQAAAIRGQNGAPQPGVAQQAVAGTENQVFALQKRIAQECLTLTEKELGQKQGAEFDQCYVGAQIGAHIGMLAKLRGSQPFANGQLQTVIQESEQVVQKHLDHAKQLAEEMTTANAPRQANQRPAPSGQAPLR